MKVAIRDLIRERTEQELIRKYIGKEHWWQRQVKRCPKCDNELEPDGFCLGSQCREVKRERC